MSKLTWDKVGERNFEIGCDQGVLYLPDDQGAYIDGVAWSGLTTVTEKPTGAESNKQYADNIPYLNLYSIEQFEATIEALTYPPEFARFDGFAEPVPGLMIGQQSRRSFGLSYRTLLGNDVVGYDLGYKRHLAYGCMASPSEKAFQTVNDSPEAMPFSWDLTTTPYPVTGYKATALLVLDSTKLDPDAMAAIELVLLGDVGVDPTLPSPDYVVSLFAGTIITVFPAMPAFNSGTNTITIPTVAGITYYNETDGDVAVPSGALVITEDTVIKARPNAGHVLTPGSDDDFFYNFTP